jgi:predicted component of type VI protein secretion system
VKLCKLYVEKVSRSQKAKAEAMIQNVIKAHENRINDLTLMSPEPYQSGRKVRYAKLQLKNRISRQMERLFSTTYIKKSRRRVELILTMQKSSKNGAMTKI